MPNRTRSARRGRFGVAEARRSAPTAKEADHACAHWRPAIATPPTNDETRINDRIRAREVRLIGADGEQIGIKPLPEALSIARAQELDLVEVASQANPPVCRIMDYGKYKYEEDQKKKESRKKSRQSEVKEMKYRPKIGSGDFDTKTKKVEKFLSEGHKVKVTIMFRGREVYHSELGMDILHRVRDTVVDVGLVEQEPRLDGRNMTMVLAPDRRAAKSRSDRAKNEDPDAATGSDESPGAGSGATEGPAATGGDDHQTVTADAGGDAGATP